MIYKKDIETMLYNPEIMMRFNKVRMLFPLRFDGEEKNKLYKEQLKVLVNMINFNK